MSDSLVDVLICSYNEAPNIPGLMESLRQQSVGPESFRVIFVDNASTDNTRQIVQGDSNGLDLQYIYEPHLGKNWACNTGYRHAIAPYVAHADADCIVHPAWVGNIVRVIHAEKPHLIGGRMLPYYNTPKPCWYLDRYNSSQRGDVPRYLAPHEYIGGASTTWQRAVVERLGGFAIGMGLKGRGMARGDETNLQVRAHRVIPNLRVYYDPSIIVYHLTRTETMSPWYWCRWMFAHGGQESIIWGRAPMAGKAALRTIVSESRMILRMLVFDAFFRNRQACPYRENYIVEVVSQRFHLLGFAVASLRTRLLSIAGHSD